MHCGQSKLRRLRQNCSHRSATSASRLRLRDAVHAGTALDALLGEGAAGSKSREGLRGAVHLPSSGGGRAVTHRLTNGRLQCRLTVLPSFSKMATWRDAHCWRRRRVPTLGKPSLCAVRVYRKHSYRCMHGKNSITGHGFCPWLRSRYIPKHFLSLS